MSDSITTEIDARATAVTRAYNQITGNGPSEWGPEATINALNELWESAVEQLPGKDEIAAVMRRHNFDEIMLGDVEWDGYTACCACGWRSEECKMPGGAHESHSQHASSYVLAFIRERYGVD